MSNLFAGGDAPHIVYDLKGSWIDRRAGRGASVLKDNDLDYKFKVGAVKKAALMKQLTEDSKLLRDLKIMDYSLLVGVVQKYEPELAGKSSGSRRKGVRSKKSPSKATSTATPASPSSGDDSSGSVGDLPDINVSAEPDTSTTASLIKVGISDDRIDRITSMDGSQQYYFGVIDILQPFDGSKKLEACFKVFFMRKNPDGISAVEPNVRILPYYYLNVV
jgi:1-phosphatidylinositol-4-phosphate 5-kinase